MPRFAVSKRWWGLCLAVLLVFAQTNGLMHRMLHGAGHAWDHGRALTVASSASDSVSLQGTVTRWVAKAWLDHGKGSDCQLFDQLASLVPPSDGSVSLSTVLPSAYGFGGAVSFNGSFERFYSA